MSLVWQPNPRWLLASQFGLTDVHGRPRSFNPFDADLDASTYNGLFYSTGPEPPWYGDIATFSMRALCWVGHQKAVYVVVPNGETGSGKSGEALYKCDEWFTSATLIDANWAAYSGTKNSDYETGALVNIGTSGFFALNRRPANTTVVGSTLRGFYYDGTLATGTETWAIGIDIQNYLNPASSSGQKFVAEVACVAGNRDTQILSTLYPSCFFLERNTRYVGGSIVDYNHLIRGNNSQLIGFSVWDDADTDWEEIYSVTFDHEGDRVLYVSENFHNPAGYQGAGIESRTSSQIKQVTRNDPNAPWAIGNVTASVLVDLPFEDVEIDSGLGTLDGAERPWLAWTSGLTGKLYYYAFQGSDPEGASWTPADYVNAGLFQFDSDGTNQEKLQHSFLGSWYESPGPRFNRRQPDLGPGTRGHWEL